ERALQIRIIRFGAEHPYTIMIRALCAQIAHEQNAQEADEQLTQTHETSSIPSMDVTIRGATGEIVYTRQVRMRSVTFTCTMCQRTVTQLHYPSGTMKYCSEACRIARDAQQQQKRVARQREKRQTRP